MPRSDVENWRVNELVDLFGVSRNTVVRWVRSGLMKSWRLPSGRGEHRVHIDEIVDFANRHGMRYVLPRLRVQVPILLAGLARVEADLCRTNLEVLGYKVMQVNSAYEMGRNMAEAEGLVVDLENIGAYNVQLAAAELVNRKGAVVVVLPYPESVFDARASDRIRVVARPLSQQTVADAAVDLMKDKVHSFWIRG